MTIISSNGHRHLEALYGSDSFFCSCFAIVIILVSLIPVVPYTWMCLYPLHMLLKTSMTAYEHIRNQDLEIMTERSKGDWEGKQVDIVVEEREPRALKS